MKRILFVFLFFISLSYMSAIGQNTYTFMSYNVHNAIGLDYKRSFQRIADVIREANVDVVAVQEVDSMTVRSGNRYVLGEIAMQSGMYPSFAPAIDYDGGKYGIGILSKVKPMRISSYPLPGLEEKRVMLLAEFNDYVFCCIHLSLNEEDRINSLDIINQIAKEISKPLFLAGDFNDKPDSELIGKLKENFRILSNINKQTYPSDKPTETIDYLMAFNNPYRKITVLGSNVINESFASDHRPVISKVIMAQYENNIFRTKPYLQNPVNNGITVMWETTVPVYSWVEFGTDSVNMRKVRPIVDGQVVCNNTLHKIRIEGLDPGKKYYYRICSQEIMLYEAYNKVFGNTAKSATYSFILPDKKDDSFTAVVFNDLHKRLDTFNALCNQIKDIDYDFVVFNGDCVDDPANREQATSFISKMIDGVRGYEKPVFFVRGNHEIRNAYSIKLRSHYDYVGDKTYSAFSWGNSRFVILDCGEDKIDNHPVYFGLNDFSKLRNEQVCFLKKEFSSKDFKKAERRILFHHIPLYGNRWKNLCTDLWSDLLQKSRFDISINGHTHSFAFHEKGVLGNSYPVIIGGGYTIDSAVAIIIVKERDKMSVKAISANGKIIMEKNL